MHEASVCLNILHLVKNPQCVVMFSPCIYATLLECPRAYVYQPRLCIFTRTFYFLLYILFHQSYHLHRHCGTIIHDQIHHFSTKALWKSPSWRTVYSRCCLNMHSFCRCHTFGLFQHVIWLCAPPMVVHVGIGQRLQSICLLGKSASVRSMARVSNSGYRFCHIARSIEDNRIPLTFKGHGTMHLIAIKECLGVVDLDLVVLYSFKFCLSSFMVCEQLSCIGATPPVAKPHSVFFSSSFSLPNILITLSSSSLTICIITLSLSLT